MPAASSYDFRQTDGLYYIERSALNVLFSLGGYDACCYFNTAWTAPLVRTDDHEHERGHGVLQDGARLDAGPVPWCLSPVHHVQPERRDSCRRRDDDAGRDERAAILGDVCRRAETGG